MKTPSIILTSQFTTPKAKSFSDYLKYMTRKEALLEKKNSLNDSEQVELSKINNVVSNYDMEQGDSYLTSSYEKERTKKEEEAAFILKSKKSFEGTDPDFEKYISYMSRQYALEKKESLSTAEEKELEVVRKKNSKHADKDIEDKIPQFKQGIFSINKDKMTSADLEEVNNIVKNSQKKGSVFYQDVISFDTDFLIKVKLYNPESNELDEQKIQYASKKMMESMFKDENISSGYWFASIHRNTDHIHIHYGTVETTNTRKLIPVKEDGIEYLAPKGKRKQETIDNMKSTFANSLVDRTAELSRISELRNTLVKDIKDSYGQEKEQRHQQNMLNELYEELPTNKKNWQYGSKFISNNTREKIDFLTESLMKDNPDYQEFIKKTEEESTYRKELYGESNRDGKDYAVNKKSDIHKRLGNSLLTEMKRSMSVAERNRELYKYAKMNPTNSSVNNSNTNYKHQQKMKKPFVNRKNFHQIKRSLNDDYNKYLAEKDYERVQQKILQEQQSSR